MSFTGREVWAHADSYPHTPMNCDEYRRIRNSNDMGYMMSPFNYINARKLSASSPTHSMILDEKELTKDGDTNENLKRHGTVENVSEVDKSLCDPQSKRTAYDFLINNVGYDGSNMSKSLQICTENIVPNTGKKRGAFPTEVEIDCKRICVKDKDDHMEIDGQSLHAYEAEKQSDLKPDNCLNSTQTQIAGIVPSQDIMYQAQYNEYSVKCDSGHKLLWQNNIQQRVVNNKIILDTFNASCYSNSIEPYVINSCDDDDVEFMYQATHGGNFMRHQSRHLDDDL